MTVWRIPCKLIFKERQICVIARNKTKQNKKKKEFKGDTDTNGSYSNKRKANRSSFRLLFSIVVSKPENAFVAEVFKIILRPFYQTLKGKNKSYAIIDHYL